MAQMLPYILPLLLGRTFDLDKMQVGIDIFPKATLEKKVIIQNPVTETHYKIVDNMVEARNLLDVEGSFSLNIKGGAFKAGAGGAYLTDTYNRENTVEVVIKATYQTVTEQLPADAKPIDTWKSLGDALGTHFVRSITYGGEMIGTVRLESNSTRDKQKIKAALEVGGMVEVFTLGVEVEGEYMKDMSKSVESTQIKVFSSIPLSVAPNDMDTLKKALDDFPQDLAKFNEGRGIPLKMELWPLSFLDSSRPDRLRNRLLEANLDGFEQKLDDLLNTKTAIANWMKVMSKPLSEEEEKKVGDFYAEVQKTMRPFYDVIGSLDMTKGTEQLKPANDAYGNSIPGIFYKKYLLLRQEIAKDQGAWGRSRGNGITYVHWGKKNCSGVAEQMSEGTVVGPEGRGGGANFLCLSDSPQFGAAPSNQKDAAVLQGTSFEYPDKTHSQLFCSTCRLGARGSVQVFVGKTTCPDQWDYLYDGLLMSSYGDGISTVFVCLDKTADKNTDFVSKMPLVPDWAVLSSDQEKELLFSCVVCAK